MKNSMLWSYFSLSLLSATAFAKNIVVAGKEVGFSSAQLGFQNGGQWAQVRAELTVNVADTSQHLGFYRIKEHHGPTGIEIRKEREKIASKQGVSPDEIVAVEESNFAGKFVNFYATKKIEKTVALPSMQSDGMLVNDSITGNDSAYFDDILKLNPELAELLKTQAPKPHGHAVGEGRARYITASVKGLFSVEDTQKESSRIEKTIEDCRDKLTDQLTREIEKQLSPSLAKLGERTLELNIVINVISKDFGYLRNQSRNGRDYYFARLPDKRSPASALPSPSIGITSDPRDFTHVSHGASYPFRGSVRVDENGVCDTPTSAMVAKAVADYKQFHVSQRQKVIDGVKAEVDSLLEEQH